MMKIIMLDIKQNLNKIMIRLLCVMAAILVFPALNFTGIFESMTPFINKIPNYGKLIMGIGEDGDLYDYRNWALFVSMLIEWIFIYIAITDIWKYFDESLLKGRRNLWRNQIFTSRELTFIEYFSVVIRFFIVWLPYKIMVLIFCKGSSLNISIVFFGIGIYLLIISLSYLSTLLLYNRGISTDYIFIIILLMLFLGNIYKFFLMIKMKIMSQGVVPDEIIGTLSQRLERLHIYSPASYLNPFYINSFLMGIGLFFIGVIASSVVLVLCCKVGERPFNP